MLDVRVSFSDKEKQYIEKSAKAAGLSKKAFIETAALNSHIAPAASDDLIKELRNLHDLCILLNDVDKTLEEKQGLIKDIRKLIRKIEKEYFSNY